MSEAALNWMPEALWEQLEPLLPGLSIEVVPRATSTNTVLLDRARGSVRSDVSEDSDGAGRDAIALESALVRRSVESGAFGRRSVDLQPCLVVAEHQSNGRGRQGRAWQSAAGASLTFSLSLPLAMADWSGLSLAVGVALCEGLEGFERLDAPVAGTSGMSDSSGMKIGLKWPNDLWLVDNDDARGAGEGRKLGGILIETVSAGAQRMAVIGIGINVIAFEADAVNTGFASLREIDASVTAPLVLARIAAPLIRSLKLFEREGFAAFAKRFAARDVLNGRAVRTTMADAPEGIASGVSAQGALLVKTPTALVSVSSGEVSVRPIAAISNGAEPQGVSC